MVRFFIAMAVQMFVTVALVQAIGPLGSVTIVFVFIYFAMSSRIRSLEHRLDERDDGPASLEELDYIPSFKEKPDVKAAKPHDPSAVIVSRLNDPKPVFQPAAASANDEAWVCKCGHRNKDAWLWCRKCEASNFNRMYRNER
jgi:hypothetical protein